MFENNISQISQNKMFTLKCSFDFIVPERF